MLVDVSWDSWLQDGVYQPNSICALVHRHTALPPAELCDPIKGVAESPPSPPHPEPSYAQLNWTEANSWTGGSMLLPHSLHFSCLSFTCPLFLLSLLISTSLSLYPSSPSLSVTLFPLHLPPESHTATIVSCALELNGSWALGGCRGEWGAPFLPGCREN